MNRAYTIVEVLIAAVAGTVLLGVLYAITFTADTSHPKVEARDEVVQAALIAAALIAKDLRELVTLPVDADPKRAVSGDQQHPCVVAEGGRLLGFYLGAPALERTPKGRLGAVATVLRAVPVHPDPGPASASGPFRLVRIQGAAADDPRANSARVLPVGGCLLAELQFRLLDPFAAAVGDPPDHRYYVEFRLVATDALGSQAFAIRETVPLRYPTDWLASSRLMPEPGGGYEALGALSTPAAPLADPTTRRTRTASSMRELAGLYESGQLGPRDLERRVHEVALASDEERP